MAEVKLNQRQREAVEQIDGPMLVLAGPGTGKTQLLSARVARILEKTDTLASNILCLTFTEYGASNMLERLTSFIGQEAYNVNISTYHAFGGELISSYPEYFTGTRLESPCDELSQHEIITAIIDKLSYQNPLKFTSARDILATISEAKQALLKPNDLRNIANENLEFLSDINPKISQIFESFTRMPVKLDKAWPYFEKVLQILRLDANKSRESLAATAAASLDAAMEEANEINKSTPLTKWKNDWLIKNKNNEFIMDGVMAAKRLEAFADVMASYEKQLSERGLYDYNDMILKVITALEKYDEFRFTCQEKYQYILLDEYQDTNAAQARLVELLTNNPVSEGRPNVMAVGDDDQAIYAFQGAEASNLKDFARRYHDTRIISLTENYRSQPDILAVASRIADNISDRASDSFDGISKKIIYSGEINQPTIVRQDFLSQVAERNSIGREIENLITKKGVKPSQIAVLAPRHKSLEPLVPFLNQLGIPVHYEKRENILEAPIIRQLVTMSRLVLALANHDENLAASLWPEILSYEFWDIELAEIWRISWSEDSNFTRKLLASKYKWIALFFMQLASLASSERLETMLDYLIGAEQLNVNDKTYKTATSTLKSYYTSEAVEREHPEIFYQTISHLTVLRQKLRERQSSDDEPLKLTDLIRLVDLYQTSGTRMINTSPYNQASESVQLMTVFKAKGLEFEHVFLSDLIDETWGEKAKDSSNKLSLPANLASIRRAGTTSDERLRIFYVALTRAKAGLYLMSYKNSYSGKATTRLKFLDEREQADGNFKALALPERYQLIITNSDEIPELISLETNWQGRHLGGSIGADIKSLLTERIKNYQLSPTHLNTFIDLERGGPRAFFLNTILRFPQAPSSATSYGNAIHETLDWYQLQINQDKLPDFDAVLAYFKNQLVRKKLSAEETDKRLEQGEFELKNYLNSAKFRKGDKSEEKFKNLGLFIEGAHLNGKIDKLELNPDDKTLTVVDYKTGKPAERWESSLKLHKYKQQLYIYKMLIEGAAVWQGWTVTDARLDFLKPDADNEPISLNLKFEQKEFEQTRQLIGAMWRHVVALDFPDVSAYSADFTGTKQFEKDLIDGRI